MPEVAGHGLAFSDCREIGQGGPEACDLAVDGRPVRGARFDPSPLPYRDGILVPVRRSGLLNSGYALSWIDPATLRMQVISKIYPYMRLIEVIDDEVLFRTRTYGDEQDRVTIALR